MISLPKISCLLRKPFRRIHYPEIILEVERIDRYGRVRKRVRKRNDYPVDNFGKLLRLVFYPANYQKRYYIDDFVDDTGTARTLVVGYGSYCWDYCYATDRKYYIAIGTDNTSPSPSDYKLGNEIGSAEASEPTVITDNYIGIRITSSIQVASDVTIWEVGLYLICCDDAGNKCRFLLLRDVLSDGITYYAGEYVSVRYEIRFPR